MRARDGHHGFYSGLSALVRRLSLLKAAEWALIVWMYLWLIGFAVAVFAATVRGYIEVFREARAFERSLWKG